MLNLNFRNGNTPALNARNLNAIVEAINTMQTQLANPFTFKGSVSSVANLPSSGNTVNDTYYVTAATCLYTWDGDSWEVSSLSESDYLAQLQKSVQYRGFLNTTTVTPETIEDIGYWSVTASTTSEYFGITTMPGALFFNLRAETTDFLQVFIFTDGLMLVRYQKDGDFKTVSLSSRRNSVENPDTITDQGIYVATSSVTYAYTGRSGQSVFICLCTPYGGVMWQGFLLKNGSIYGRYGTSGSFSCESADSISTLQSERMYGLEMQEAKIPVQTENGKIWNGTELVGNANYTAYKYNLDGREKINVIGAQASVAYLLATIYDSGGNVLYDTSQSVETGSGKKEIVIITPSDASYMWVNTFNTTGGGAFSISYDTDPSSLKPLKVEITNNGCFVENKEFRINLRKVGANDIFNVYSLYYLGTLIFATQTDWFGPYNFTKNGGSGDFENITTGGNHSASDGETTVTTGRTISVSYYLDGEQKTDVNTYYANECVIEWTNEIMAGNTVKLDGTGEYCLEEHYKVVIDQDMKLDVEHWFKVNSNGQMNWYSGLQLAAGTALNEIIIPQYTDSVLTTGTINANIIRNKPVNRFLAIGQDVGVEMYLDRDWGMAANDVRDSVTGNTSKAYFTQQGYYDTPIALKKDDVYLWRGHMKFFRNF